MPNLRIIYDNAADRATLTASSTSGALVAANMLTERKSQVHRSAGTSVSYTLTWAADETVGGVALPACNLSADSTIRVRLYSDAAGTTLVADSGVLYAAPGLDLDLWDWSQPLNVNSFYYGGVSKTAVWFPDQLAARRCVIDLVDTNNAAGYIDCARLVVGAFWEPTYNAQYGVEVQTVDMSEVARADSGDLRADRGPLHDRLALDLAYLPGADRAALMNLFRRTGASRNLLLSLLPDATPGSVEQDHLIYGKRSNQGLVFDAFNAYSTKLEVEGW